MNEMLISLLDGCYEVDDLIEQDENDWYNDVLQRYADRGFDYERMCDE